MGTTSTTVTVLLMGAAVFVGGCARKAKTPEEAVTNFIESIQTGNKALFTASLDSDDREVVEVAFECLSAAFDFQSRFQKTYGRQPCFRIRNAGTTAADYRDLDIAIEPGDADSAVTATVGQGHKPLTVVKKGEWWYVDLSDLLPAPDRREEGLRAGRAIAQTFSKQKTRIGNEGLTPEDIEQEAVMAFLMTWIDAEQRASGQDGNSDWKPDPTPQPRVDDAVATSYTVRPGDTLTAIARKTYGPGHAGNYRRIFEANRDKLNSPDLIPIGIELTIPKQ